MDLETHEIFIERNVQFVESSPNLSFNPLYTSYIVETDNDTSNSDLIDSDMWDPIDRYRERSYHHHIQHAYIVTVIGPTQ